MVPPMSPPPFEVKNLSLSFGSRRLFTDLSFSLEEAETLVLQGASGSGKSTLLRILANLTPREGGEIRLDDKPIESWSPVEWRSKLMLVAQRPLLGSDCSRGWWEHLVEFGIHAERKPESPLAHFPKLLLDEKLWTEPVTTLSGGERQRVALAIALALQPRILLLDEPTSALDDKSRDAVEDILSSKTTLWVTHDKAQAARVSNHIIELVS